MTFCANNSRPVVFNGLPKDRCDELLGNLLSCIYENFRACDRPESYLVRADVGNIESETGMAKKVMVIGASNMKHVARSLQDKGVPTEQITIPGWMCSPENVSKIKEEMETKSLTAGAFVYDLLSNSTLRFKQFDGTTSLPFKSNGKFHYGGRILVVPNDLFKKLVVAILPILKAKGDRPCVILPPLPRSLFMQCCNDNSHCTNIKDAGFSEELLSGYIRLRNELIKQLVSHGLSSFKVLDSCCMTSCSKTASIAERLKQLRETMAKDDTHFLEAGYRNIAERCMTCINLIVNSEKTTVKRSGPYFWRGFKSPNGSSAPRPAGGHPSVGRGSSIRGNARGGFRGAFRGRRGRAYHPYQRW
jgi:hypothetical protein